MSSLFDMNSKYNFDLYPAAILGNDFKNVTVIGIINPTIAQSFIDIEASHFRVYPYLPPGTPDSPRDYDYLMLKTTSGATTVIGIPWINKETITLVESGTMQVELLNVTSEDISRVSDALVANGFNVFNIKMKANG